ncbi:hypothetical protein N7478_008540 [Penicillium angulare]|uniref:uncharacterized protein n=1 Tax=Penicillium angulare TaxID=116970 RepID=UPI0025424981|nr:uncharacterized protein N7478_008540 [Penicillium angulare]KAJ5273415.1 hypothetical protein N7478_008540 [Penicillium angulare]
MPGWPVIGTFDGSRYPGKEGFLIRDSLQDESAAVQLSDDVPFPQPTWNQSLPTSQNTKLLENSKNMGPLKFEIKDSNVWLPVGTFNKVSITRDNLLELEISILSENDWIRTQTSGDTCNLDENIRVYVNTLATDPRNTKRGITKLRGCLRIIMSKIDRTAHAWTNFRRANLESTQTSDGSDTESLWYIFNTLDNPNPDCDSMKDIYSRRAMQDLLFGDDLSEFGLKATLYPYQRRSAAMMIQREVQPAPMLDPRFQTGQTPTGIEYYYDKEDVCIIREKQMYSEACGGILAETMGCGKTLICLAVIWATRGHVPNIPIQYLSHDGPEDFRRVRDKVGSLMEMAAAAAGRHCKPWKAFFLKKQQEEGSYHERCIEACQAHCGSYTIPSQSTRYQGRQNMSYPRPPDKHIRLCSGTLVIVPNNLVDHWKHEISNHTEGLKTLIIRQGADKTPSADDLLDYDIIVFSKTRFEKESGEPVNNRQNSSFSYTESSLLQLHWLRVIVDEGENAGSQGTRMSHFFKELHFERRWVISGTPSTGLYGVEVSLASQEALTSDTESSQNTTSAILKGRKKTGNAVENELKDLDRMKYIVINFLDLKPWSNPKSDDPADWTKYIKPYGDNGKRRKTPAVRALLQGLVVRHQLDVISNEITLPKLYNKIVHLGPTFYDRLSINLFLFGLAVNSITSERQGSDYMFDPSNRKHLNQVINNLRQAGFWWAGSDINLQDTVKHAQEYVEKNSEKMTSADIKKLNRGFEIASRALGSSSWHEFKELHELGVLVLNFPEDNRDHWALNPGSTKNNPLLTGITQARRAQHLVTENLRLPDPTQGLSGHGIKVRSELRQSNKKPAKGAPESIKIPTSPSQLSHTSKPLKRKLHKKTFSRHLLRSLPEDSDLKNTKLIATTSAKLTYLLDRVLEFYKTEKIIIFYDNNNSAYWIAEGLELLGVEFRIYASTLSPELRTKYLNLFREESHVRVLLMDLRQASHGLHLAQASRVFIVNPIWQPNVESQAIKRAHRIGQTRPVYVETLVLKDTLEDRMLSRRKEMSEAEIQHAEKSLLDDAVMSDIIQSEDFLEMFDEAETGAAFLRNQTGFFDRHSLPIPDDEEVDSNNTGGNDRPFHLPVVESDADDRSEIGAAFGEGFESPPVKKSRVGFASRVQLLDDDEGDTTRSSGPEPTGLFSATVLSGLLPLVAADENHDQNRKVSIFGP